MMLKLCVLLILTVGTYAGYARQFAGRTTEFFGSMHGNWKALEKTTRDTIISTTCDAGPSLISTSVGAGMNHAKSTVVGGSVENYSKYELTNVNCRNDAGYINKPLRPIHSGEKEAWAQHQGVANTDTTMICSAFIQGATYKLAETDTEYKQLQFNFYVYAPNKFTTYSNQIAVGVCDQAESDTYCKKFIDRTSKEIYGNLNTPDTNFVGKDGTPWLKNMNYYDVIKELVFCRMGICIVAKMGSAHKSEAMISVYSETFDGVSNKIKKAFEKAGKTKEDYEEFILDFKVDYQKNSGNQIRKKAATKKKKSHSKKEKSTKEKKEGKQKSRLIKRILKKTLKNKNVWKKDQVMNSSSLFDHGNTVEAVVNEENYEDVDVVNDDAGDVVDVDVDDGEAREKDASGNEESSNETEDASSNETEDKETKSSNIAETSSENQGSLAPVYTNQTLAKRDGGLSAAAIGAIASLIVTGASLVDTTVSGIMDTSQTISLGGELENYSKYDLVKVDCVNENGYINKPLRSIHAGTKEAFAAHYSTSGKGIWLYCKMRLSNKEDGSNKMLFSQSFTENVSTLLHFMISAPNNFDLHSNSMAVAVCESTDSCCTGLNAEKMYYKDKRRGSMCSRAPVKFHEYYYQTEEVVHCNKEICMVANMGTSHQPVINMQVFGKTIQQASPKLADLFKSVYKKKRTAEYEAKEDKDKTQPERDEEKAEDEEAEKSAKPDYKRFIESLKVDEELQAEEQAKQEEENKKNADRVKNKIGGKNDRSTDKGDEGKDNGR